MVAVLQAMLPGYLTLPGPPGLPAARFPAEMPRSRVARHGTADRVRRWRKMPKPREDREAPRRKAWTATCPPKPVSTANKERLWQWKDAQSIEEVKELNQELIDGSLLNTRYEYQKFMKELRERHLWEEAIALLAEKRRRPVGIIKPELDETNAAMQVCAEAQQWEHALGLLNSMRRSATQVPDSFSFNIVLASLEQNGEWQKALQLLEVMERYYRRDYLTFASVISASAQGQKWAQAMDLLGEMIYFDMKPDFQTYNLGLLMAQKGGMWQESIFLLDDMWQETVCPEQLSYGSAIETCCRCGEWQAGLALLRVMPRKGFEVMPSTRTLVADACEAAGNLAQAERLRKIAKSLGR